MAVGQWPVPPTEPHGTVCRRSLSSSVGSFLGRSGRWRRAELEQFANFVTTGVRRVGATADGCGMGHGTPEGGTGVAPVAPGVAPGASPAARNPMLSLVSPVRPRGGPARRRAGQAGGLFHPRHHLGPSVGLLPDRIKSLGKRAQHIEVLNPSRDWKFVAEIPNLLRLFQNLVAVDVSPRHSFSLRRLTSAATEF